MWDAWCGYQLTVTHEGGGVWLEVSLMNNDGRESLLSRNVFLSAWEVYQAGRDLASIWLEVIDEQ
jgi:hypothetical protein